jgi:hypothetical protein
MPLMLSDEPPDVLAVAPLVTPEPLPLVLVPLLPV